MEVILKEDVGTLGSRGDVVKVAEGYGRNFLLPRKLAIEATTGNKAVIAQMKAASVRRSAKEKTQAEELAKQFEGLAVSFQRRSVSARGSAMTFARPRSILSRPLSTNTRLHTISPGFAMPRTVPPPRRKYIGGWRSESVPL